jgi:hypothetical protein
MNKSQFYTLSGVLLASTALAGVANAGSVGFVPVTGVGQINTTAKSVSTTLFGGTTAQRNAVTLTALGLSASFTNSLAADSRFNVTLNVAGAEFNNLSVGVSLLTRATAGGTFTTTVGGACANITPLVDKILINNCELSTGTANFNTGLVGGIMLSGATFNNAGALATAGTSISLSGTVNDNANPSIVIENITSGNVVTSANPLTTTVTAGGGAVTNPATTPTAFTNFTSSAGQSGLTVTLATVAVTATGALGTDLTTMVTANPAGGDGARANSSITITVESATLSDDALVSLYTTGALAGLTPATFSGGTATLTDNATDASGSTVILARYNGTAAIDSAAAGTVTVAYGGGVVGTARALAPTGASGATAAISAGGFSAEFNTAQASGTEYQSFIRIHNNGTSAGTVTITVLNDADGTTLGTHTTGSIAVGQTMQVGMPAIEAGAGITSPSGQYTLKLTGPIVGYAQHVLWNSTTGQFTDLSGFRNAGSTNNVP